MTVGGRRLSGGANQSVACIYCSSLSDMLIMYACVLTEFLLGFICSLDESNWSLFKYLFIPLILISLITMLHSLSHFTNINITHYSPRNTIITTSMSFLYAIFSCRVTVVAPSQHVIVNFFLSKIIKPQQFFHSYIRSLSFNSLSQQWWIFLICNFWVIESLIW